MSFIETSDFSTDLGEILASLTASDIEIRLASGVREIRAAQKLRYRVFYEEMNAIAGGDRHRMGLDFDRFDDIADHLLVIDKSQIGIDAQVVGTYRLLRQSQAQQAGGFYSESEYDITPLVNLQNSLLELGRSCIDSRYRKGRVMDLLWRGLAAYFTHHDIDIMFGCASLPGTNPDSLMVQLSYLYHNHTAPKDMCPTARSSQYVDMNRLSKMNIDAKSAFVSLPPLIKGYLRAGCLVGDGAVVDYQFNSIDICVIMNIKQMSNRYQDRFMKYDPKDL